MYIKINRKKILKLKKNTFKINKLKKNIVSTKLKKIDKVNCITFKEKK